jgi:hypothetical protein
MDIGLQGRGLEALSDAIKSDYCFKPFITEVAGRTNES